MTVIYQYFKGDNMEKIKKEIRILKTAELRVMRDGDNPVKIEGYAAVFNKDSENMGFIERIAPGAFKNALKTSDVRALFNHDSNIILGRKSAGTLELKEDKKGLFMSVTPPDTQLVRDMVLTPIERGDITQQSFGFNIKSDEWKDLDKDVPTRTIMEVNELYDVSPVTFPAYPDTEVALRSLDNIKKDILMDAKDTSIRALAEKRNLDIDIKILERSEGGLKR